MLKQDGVLCSFSPCIEQVQRTCETIHSSFTDIRTFEILLRAYEIRACGLESNAVEEGVITGPLPQKRRHFLPSGKNTGSIEKNGSVIVRPCSSARGHTGYLTFARLKVHEY